jgi:short-subunit dehydrogenase
MNRVVLISGASSGIGLSLANKMHEDGYTVIGLSRKTPSKISFKYYECDLTNTEQIQSICKQISTEYPIIDILINCAGVGTGGAIEEISDKDLRWVYDVNLFGTIELIKNILPALKSSNNAKIINIGSVAGEITIPYQASYSMSKSSIQRLTEGLRMELKQFNIDACTVLPGDTKTDFTSNRKTVLNENSPYKINVERSIAKMEKDEQNGVSPNKVVNVIYKVIKRKKMPIQVIVGFDYKFLVFLSRVLPRRLVEFIITKMYG